MRMCSLLVIAALAIATVVGATACKSSGTDASGTDAGTDAATDAGGTDSGGTDAGPPPVDLTCVGTTWWPAPAGPTATIDVTVLEPFLGMPVAGAVVDAFDVADVGETTVLATATTGGSGTASITLPLGVPGFGGYGRITTSDVNYHSTYEFRNQPVVADGAATFGLLTNLTWDLLYGTAGVTEDPTLGAIAVTIFDCNSNPLPGATLEVAPADAATVVAYVVNMMPDVSATTTDQDGVAAVLNSAVGPVTLTVSYAMVPAGPPITVGDLTVEVRTSVLTDVTIWPE